MLNTKFATWATLLLIGAMTLIGTPAQADWPEKPVRLIVPYSPGGGFDTFARLFAPELEKALGTDIIVDNIPGAGGRRGIETMMKSDADGYTIGMFNIPGMVIAGVTGKWPDVDLRDIAWVSNLTRSPYTLVLSASGGLTSADDLCALGRPAKLATTGAGSSSHTIAVILMESLGCAYTVVPGYKGSTETTLAVIRGEVDGMFASVDTARKFIESGDIRIGLTFSTTTLFDGVPTTTEIGQNRLSSLAQLRMIGAPPGTPSEILAKLDAAFQAAATSASIAEWSASTKRPVTYMDADSSARAINEQFDVMQSFASAFQ
ncbi:tripartite tricarboxylate transporter substrate binding protein [Aliiroseovarius sp. S1123]|jgi:tripartite-type tricarboxylate transporter receptor subunit TctC|uniref:Bug family tripartite tricarboxylate transporter substrate binding protein n=1 Tax=unclassified Aliiroseovarius TaxID=2623558 RepID=UPI001FF66695|nr:tripartite tricarboxylate transporter substrate binding protein [Aliiroseovarius sp. S1123]MCK0172365.1 tripartite tricarboxylate transporter substrate binding protein [Aliiroseovarius sp. S1123]